MSATGMQAFSQRFPVIGPQETRVIQLLAPEGALPAGRYAFIEFYCVDPGCDCRRVIIQVWSEDPPGKALAAFNYGWETLEFYTKWMHGDRQSAREMAGVSLEPFGPQSEHSQVFFNFFKDLLLKDSAYIERLKRHYAKFKQSIKPDLKAQWLQS